MSNASRNDVPRMGQVLPEGRHVMDEWYEDRGELLTFARVLADSGELDGPKGTINYFEKPWNWTAERERWVAAGRPDEMPEVR